MKRATSSELRHKPSPAFKLPSSEGQLDATLFQTVTVVVTVYNRAEYLEQAVASAVSQLSVREVIVVDDATDHKTHPYFPDCLAKVKTLGRVQIIRNNQNLGLAGSRNEGLKLVTTPFVCFLDDDDFFISNSLDARVAHLHREGVEIAGTYCDWVACTEADDPSFEHREEPAKRTHYVTYRSLSHGSPFISSAPLLRTSVIRAMGGFDPTLRRSEDYELWGRILNHGYLFRYTPVVGVAYRRTSGGLVLSNPAAQLAEMSAVRINLMKTPDESGGSSFKFSIDDYDFAWTTARYTALIALTGGAVDASSMPPPFIFAEGIEKIVKEAFKYARARLNIHNRTQISIAQAKMSNSLATVLETAQEKLMTFENQAAGRDSLATWSIVRFNESQQQRRIVLVAESPYHCAELLPLAEILESQGFTTLFMESAGTMDETRRIIRSEAGIAPYNEDLVLQSAGLVSLNDWGHLARLYEKLRAANSPCVGFAKVEGVQDFEDLDTGRQRLPYQRASVVLCQGMNDYDALRGKVECHMVGSSRLEALWKDVATGQGVGCIVNQNFTYNVLEDQRSDWLASISRAMAATEYRYTVSAHPADTTRMPNMPYAQRPFSELCQTHSILVSRFSTVFYEAACHGMRLIYHNPHFEKSEKYLTHLTTDFLTVTRSSDELQQAIHEVPGLNRRDVKSELEDWFGRQVDMADESSAERSARIIETVLANR